MSPRASAAKPKRTMGNKNQSSDTFLGLGSYFDESRRPMAVLVFLLPLAVLYEMGARLYGSELVAFRLLRVMAGYFSIYGRGVPAGLLVLSLLACQLIKRDPWRVKLGTLGNMLLESLFLALPVFIISILCQHYLPMAGGSHMTMGARWALSLGAGVYEELVFRFYLCGALKLLFDKLLGLKPLPSVLLTVLISSVAFSLYHYLGSEHFSIFSFVFRSVAGAYFAVLFWYRGLGISAGSHAAYDLIVVTFCHAQ
jgi:membrane protease YdiL (CAAX protease family)